jgi:hypothetical protein
VDRVSILQHILRVDILRFESPGSARFNLHLTESLLPTIHGLAEIDQLAPKSPVAKLSGFAGRGEALAERITSLPGHHDSPLGRTRYFANPI